MHFGFLWFRTHKMKTKVEKPNKQAVKVWDEHTRAHSLSKSISYFSSSKCKSSTSRYENRASRSGDSNAKLELVNVKLAKVEVEINLC